MSTAPTIIISGGNEQSKLEMINSLLDDFPKVQIDSQNPDLIFQTTSESSIGIEEIRNFQKQISIKPSAHKIKVGIISPAEKLTEEAQNSLLKTLEEPPENTHLFLLCQSESILISTILSRSQIITLPDLKLDLTSVETKTLEQNLKILSSDSLGSKFKLAAEVSSSRESAINCLDQLLVFFHQKFSLTSENNSNLTGKTKQIFESKKRLKANSNVRLTMENLFLNW